MEGISLDAEAGAEAENLDDLFQRLEASGRLVRIDPSWRATMYRGTMLSARELEALRQITDVVRLGRVRRIEADRIVLERGETETGADVLHVDCTALGLNNAPATPIFQPGRIVIQQIRHLSPSFNAALIGFVEGHRDDDADKNRLCPPNPYASTIKDWPRMMSRTWRTEARWLSEPDVSAWVADSRLNLLRLFPIRRLNRPRRWPSSGFSRTLLPRSSGSRSSLNRAIEHQAAPRSSRSAAPAFITAGARRPPFPAPSLAREARKATASTPRRSSMRVVLARRPNPASSGAAAAPPVGSVLVSDTSGRVGPVSDDVDHRIGATAGEVLLDA